mmetsp:Transcript_48731/g.74141  ORF Transcript_48731/g.74141 Transcript_48731/m.74141 type:complete len:435 (+) Transcript_48731:119-1423(+)|eukprot:CAMPEP_0117012008 /NCGR_PEP_ID=MMETSP0472-20121206/10202_1 /TAXON_ID=693140 ORGANISM="Tiarina fusus, Strain LIS" /NCGR_SAMPLE_ID=MMETSP0472 /ASSEMBLY_ACC=CAM_ASM_000603 /LENGTH=434 /DNA_ID=CAMNT_0004714975 /DNA_START=119 /DNA_END=1423 /DNA_ORIENTATION=+
MRKAWFLTKCLSTLPLIVTVSSAISDLHSSRQVGSAPASVPVATMIPRGGGWFGLGNGNGNRRNGNGNGGDDDDDGQFPKKKRYPALTQEEIEEKLDIPVFGITSQGSNGIAVGSVPDQGDMVYFFLSQEMAEQALKTMQASNQGVKLQLTALSLGKIWFRLLHNEDRTIECTPLGASQNNGNNQNKQHKTYRKKVSFRLVAGARDYFLARLLTSLSPLEAEQLRMAVQSDSKDEARDIVMKATSSSKAFTSPYNEIPLFMMPQMRVQLRTENDNDDENSSGDETTTPNGMVASSLPMFLSAKDMIKAYFRSNPNHNYEDMKSLSFSSSSSSSEPPPTIQLVELHQLVKLMQEESDFDFRSVVLFTPSTDDSDNNQNGDDDDDNDGGGGDFGLRANDQQQQQHDDVQVEMFECTPYVSMDTGEWDGYGSLLPVS